jgi:hypothetical protein
MCSDSVCTYLCIAPVWCVRFSVQDFRMALWRCVGPGGPSVSAGCGVSLSCRVQIDPGGDRCEVSLCTFEYCVMESQ